MQKVLERFYMHEHYLEIIVNLSGKVFGEAGRPIAITTSQHLIVHWEPELEALHIKHVKHIKHIIIMAL